MIKNIYNFRITLSKQRSPTQAESEVTTAPTLAPIGKYL